VFRSLKNTERVYKNSQAAKVQEVERKDPGNIAVVAPLVKGALYRRSFQVGIL
jgi:hypothetical protein